MCRPNTLWAEEADIYQSFSGLPNYSKNFYLSWCCSNFQRKSNPIFFQIFFCLQICKIFLSSKSSKSLGNLKRFSKVTSEKVGSKSQNSFPKFQSFLKSMCFHFLPFFFFFGGGGGGGGGKVSLALLYFLGQSLFFL